MADTTIDGLTITDYGQQTDASEVTARASLAARYGSVWDTDELQRDFDVLGFAAPNVIVRRKRDGARGTLEFTHEPRLYFSFWADCSS